MNQLKIQILLLAAVCAAFVQITTAQTTAFTYQGRLTDGAQAASGNYDLNFALYDAETGGTQIGTPQTRPNVNVSNGIFTVTLNFGANAFISGANRFMEIAVKKPSETDFTTLAPRQPLTASPYSIRTLSATAADSLSTACVGCVTDVQISSINGAKVSGTVANAMNATQLGGTTASNFVQTDSTTFVRNQTTQQASTHFNVSGTGEANVLSAVTEFRLGDRRVLSNAGTFNLFVGHGAGGNNSGTANSFFGFNAGNYNAASSQRNSFFGAYNGFLNRTGNNNSFFGMDTGFNNTTGSDNSFFGLQAGYANTTGSQNTLLGSNANVGADNLSYSTAIGAGAIVSSSNTVVLGRTADTVQIPGNLSVTGTISGTINGASLTNLNAANITSGTLNNAQLGIIPIANGGTGSTTKNFVDLTSEQTVNGNKTFINPVTFNNTVSGNIFSAMTDFRIGGSRILSNAGTNNLFVGTGAGNANTDGEYNTFTGYRAGFKNITGSNNTFVGDTVGLSNTTGDSNSFFGGGAGYTNTTGGGNSFFGSGAGYLNTTGGNNTFIGSSTGFANTTGTQNTLLGWSSKVGANNLTYATAIGAGAIVSSNNTVVLGRPTDAVSVPGNLTVDGTISGTINGASLTNLNASNITSGTLDNARLGIIPIANGGTGSTTKNFVDLTSEQNNIGGNKTFINPVTFNDTVKGNIFNATTDFRINSTRILSIGGTNNIFAGAGAGNANTTGFGNAFFGKTAGYKNTAGYYNVFVGENAGYENTTGSDNVFVGIAAGSQNTDGGGNAFFGRNAGAANTTGGNNTMLGTNANVVGGNLTNATAIGAGATVSSSNTVVLGRTADTVQIPGNLSVNGTLNGTLANNSVGSTQIIDGSVRLTDLAVDSIFVARSQFTVAPLSCVESILDFTGHNVAVGDVIYVYPSNATPAGIYIQPTTITSVATVKWAVCNTLNAANTVPGQNFRVVIVRP